jgi:hypothetical protein
MKKKYIPGYIQMLMNIKKKLFKQIADDYESQTEIINSVQSALVSPIEAANRAFMSNLVSKTGN